MNQAATELTHPKQKIHRKAAKAAKGRKAIPNHDSVKK
jgi:hypothetical protein